MDDVTQASTAESFSSCGDFSEQVEMDESLLTKFTGLPNIPGLATNFAVVFHDEKIISEKLTGGKALSQLDRKLVLKEELAFVGEICRYLMKNGVDKVRVISAIKQTVKLIGSFLVDECPEKEVLHDEFEVHPIEDIPQDVDVVDVTVVALIGNGVRQSRMAALIKEAIKLSRVGILIFGPCTMLDDEIIDDGWGRFLEFVKANNLWTSNLEIYCAYHNRINRHISNGEDLVLLSPLGGCMEFCGMLPCGHPCSHPCHPLDRDHETEEYRCVNPCERVCPQGHPCLKICGMECDTCEEMIFVNLMCCHSSGLFKIPCYKLPDVKCEVEVRRKLPCGHSALIKCSDNLELIKCEEVVMKVLGCDHLISFKCYKRTIMERYQCQLPRELEYQCGHRITVTCSALEEMQECTCLATCGKLLDCGHRCEKLCHPEEDPYHLLPDLCNQKCEKTCRSGTHPCGKKHPCRQQCEPCDKMYLYKFVCGHSISLKCSEPVPDENTYFCEMPCLKMHFCRHPCRKRCGEDCGYCEHPIYKSPVGCTKGHVIAMRCFERDTKQCEYMTPYYRPGRCGHWINVPCKDVHVLTIEQATGYCTVKCGKPLTSTGECGHVCQGTCRECYQGRFHAKCEEECQRTLICGHSCPVPCNVNCPPCPRQCLNVCEHQHCEYECGVPCKWTCEEPCPYSCEHSKCTKKCFEVCDKVLCSEPCPVVLECGHSCIGFCGEICPPFCRVCDPEPLLIGMTIFGTELSETDKFIFLTACRHCIESGTMDTWMNLKDSEEDEILPKRCPICRTRLGWMRRYSAVMHENRRRIDSVRAKMFGDIEEVKRVTCTTRLEILEYMEDIEVKGLTADDTLSVGFPEILIGEIEKPMLERPCIARLEFLSMSLNKAKFVEWIWKEWMEADNTFQKLNITMEDMESIVVGFRIRWGNLFFMISRRFWPLDQNEMQHYRMERQRMFDAVQLYSLFSTAVAENDKAKQSLMTTDGIQRFRLTLDKIWRLAAYTPELRKEYMDTLEEMKRGMRITIEISDEERLNIVGVFGVRAGRWFKCVNGHVYVITECGGAMELGQCNECGATIGGENHMMAVENYLASEMDGAHAPLYPTAFDRG